MEVEKENGEPNPSCALKKDDEIRRRTIKKFKRIAYGEQITVPCRNPVKEEPYKLNSGF